MFCHKCGAKMPDESAFCSKCGTKLLSENLSDTSNSDNTNVSAVQLKKSAVSEPQQPIHSEQSNDDNEFKSFIDKRVQEMTKCNSAEELIKKHPMRIPMIICYGLCLWLGLKLSSSSNYFGVIIGCILFSLLLGILLSYIIGFVKMIQYLHKHRKNLGGEISGLDKNTLILYLNKKLAYLKPQMGNWGYFSQIFVESANDAANSVTEYLREKSKDTVRLGSQCDKWYSPFSIIALRTDKDRPDITKYEIISGTTSAGLFNMSVYSCMYRTAPIISAAIEYYRENQQDIINEYGFETLDKSNMLCINLKQELLARNAKIIAIIAALILGVITIADFNSKAYIKQISNIVPTVMEEEGMNYSFGQVFDKYIEAQKWEKDVSGDEYNAYLNGKIKETDDEIKIVFHVTEYDDYSDIKLSSVELNNAGDLNEEATFSFIYNMFTAYDQKLSPSDFCFEMFDSGSLSETVSESDPLPVESNTVTETETITTKEEDSEEIEIPPAYRQLIEEFYSQLTTGISYSPYTQCIPNGTGSADMGFKIWDLNDDGVLELIIAWNTEGYDDFIGNISCLFTLRNGEVIPLINGFGYTGGQETYYICEKKNHYYIKCSWYETNSPYGGHTFYRIDTDEDYLHYTVCALEYDFSYIPSTWYNAITKEQISENEAMDLLQSYRCVPIDITLFYDCHQQ